MMSFLVLFIVSVIAVEAATELLVKSVILSGLKEKIASKGDFFRELISCGYCTSVWISVLPAFYLSCSQKWFNPILVFPLLVLALHRSANYLHNINDKHFDKFYSKE